MVGDLNYRLIGEPYEVINEIASAAKKSIKASTNVDYLSAEENKCEVSDSESTTSTAEGTWLDERYRGLEVGGWGRALIDAWHGLLCRDELTRAVAYGDCLHGFREGKINFPPSYRRARGPDGDCWEYTDTDRLRAAYTTHLGAKSQAIAESFAKDFDLEESKEVRVKGVKIRVPSYTDRIW